VYSWHGQAGSSHWWKFGLLRYIAMNCARPAWSRAFWTYEPPTFHLPVITGSRPDLMALSTVFSAMPCSLANDRAETRPAGNSELSPAGAMARDVCARGAGLVGAV